MTCCDEEYNKTHQRYTIHSTFKHTQWYQKHTGTHERARTTTHTQITLKLLSSCRASSTGPSSDGFVRLANISDFCTGTSREKHQPKCGTWHTHIIHSLLASSSTRLTCAFLAHREFKSEIKLGPQTHIGAEYESGSGRGSQRLYAGRRRCTPLKTQSTPYRKVINDARVPLLES